MVQGVPFSLGLITIQSFYVSILDVTRFRSVWILRFNDDCLEVGGK